MTRHVPAGLLVAFALCVLAAGAPGQTSPALDLSHYPLWFEPTGEPTLTGDGSGTVGAVEQLVVSLDGLDVVITPLDGTQARRVRVGEPGLAAPCAVAATATTAYVVAPCGYGTIVPIDLQSGQRRNPFPVPCCPSQIAVSGDERTLVVGGEELDRGQLHVLDLPGGEFVDTIEVLGRPRHILVDGTLFVTVSTEGPPPFSHFVLSITKGTQLLTEQDVAGDPDLFAFVAKADPTPTTTREATTTPPPSPAATPTASKPAGSASCTILTPLRGDIWLIVLPTLLMIGLRWLRGVVVVLLLFVVGVHPVAAGILKSDATMRVDSLIRLADLNAHIQVPGPQELLRLFAFASPLCPISFTSSPSCHRR